MLDHNEAQLDFILEMYSIDHPDQLKFERPGKKEPGLKEVEEKVGWANVLIGKALEAYMNKHMPSQGVLDKLRGLNSPAGNVVQLGPKNLSGNKL